MLFPYILPPTTMVLQIANMIVDAYFHASCDQLDFSTSTFDRRVLLMSAVRLHGGYRVQRINGTLRSIHGPGGRPCLESQC